MIAPDSNWAPITLTPDEETEFAERMAQRILPLMRLASVIGILAFAGYQFWDLMLDPEALSKTGPIRLAAVIWFMIGIAITYLPVVRDRPSLIPWLGLTTYSVVAVGLGATLAQLPGGFVAGVSGFLLGMIFIPMLIYKFWHAFLIVLPLVVIPLVTMAVAGASRFEIINAFSWISGGAGVVIVFA